MKVKVSVTTTNEDGTKFSRSTQENWGTEEKMIPLRDYVSVGNMELQRDFAASKKRAVAVLSSVAATAKRK